MQKYKVTPRKSLTLEYPNLMNWINMRHFIRGYFDGDGCVSYNGKRNYIRINFKGTYEFLDNLKTKMKGCLGIKGYISKSKNTDKNVYDYFINGNIASVNFLNWIYNDSKDSNRLARKYEKAKRLYELTLSKRIKPFPVLLDI